MRKLPPLILLVLLSSICLAHPITEPVLASLVDATVTKSGTVRAIGGSLTSVELNVSAPQSTAWQAPDYQSKVVLDQEGNAFFHLSDSSPSNPFTYSISTCVRTAARTTASLPGSYSTPAELSCYLLPAKGIESGDPGITALAKEITAGSADDFDKVARLAIWVHGNVVYDESYAGQEKGAKWALENKRGVCTEFTSLFIALARAGGIPTRYVSGYSYTTDRGWFGHAWAESYIGKWVPVDATWMEAGHLDATHIQVSSSASQLTGSSVLAYMTPGARLDWTGSGSFGSAMSEVSLSDSESKPAESAYEFKAGAGTIGFGGETVAYVRVTSQDYRVIDLNLEPCIGAGSVQASGKQKYAVLEPREERIIVWKLTAPSNLDSGYSYTCPVVLNSAYLAESTASIKMLSGVSDMGFGARLEKEKIPLGESQAVYFSSPSPRKGAKITVISDDEMQSFSATASEQKAVFTPKTPGAKKVWVFSSFGGVKELDYEVKESLSVSIKSVIVPEALLEGGQMPVSVILASNRTGAERAKITVSYGGSVQSYHVEFFGGTTLNTTFLGISPGSGMVLVKVEIQGLETAREEKVYVTAKPVVTMQTGFSNGGNLTNVTFTPSRTGEPRRILVYIDGKIAPLEGGSGTIGIEPGSHGMKVLWYDSFGNEYSFQKTLQVPSKGTAFGFSQEEGGPCPSFLIPLALLALAAFASAKKMG